MQLVFEEVSYAYASLTETKKPKKSRRFFGKKKEEQAAAEKPAWGNDPAEKYALHQVSLQLNEGDFLGICGHTGSGKSTLIQHMNGLLTPTEGRVLLDGRDLSNKDAQKECRGMVGVVFQYPEHQLFAQSVYDDVAFGPRNLGLSEDEIDARVRKALADVRLDFDTISPVSPFELSGGQQRRVAFAGVLAMQPRILVLDEPAAGLDPAARSSFLSLIKELHEQGLTVVMVSHSMEDLAQLCSRIIVLNQGRVFAQGTPEQVFSDAEGLKSIGLDVPAAQRVANKLRARGIALPGTLYSSAEQLSADVAKLYRELHGEDAGMDAANQIAAGKQPLAASQAATGGAGKQPLADGAGETAPGNQAESAKNNSAINSNESLA
ncbi:MAG: energy-coupling factor transporter ATPase [Coriobacteriia bacterium]|nr:energy-coupling factor transporter ATPase [Coriobacteriia bacterium]